jgi:hypothetical protein
LFGCALLKSVLEADAKKKSYNNEIYLGVDHKVKMEQNMRSKQCARSTEGFEKAVLEL